MNRPRLLPLLSTLAALLLLGAVGCRSSRHDNLSQDLKIPPKPLPAARRSSVWQAEEVVPYSLGRYVDPSDSGVLHEAHTIYRREQPVRPNLASPATQVFPPAKPAPDSAVDVVQFYRDALTAELKAQRATSAQIIDQSRQLQQNMGTLIDQANSLRQALEEDHQIRTQWPALTNRLDQLERLLEEGREAPSRSARERR